MAAIPEQMGAGLAQLFETVKPNPQEVADAVVDPATGDIVRAANEGV